MNVIVAAPARTPTQPVWVKTEPGSYVAHRSGVMVGAVVATEDGYYVALDVDRIRIGRYHTLEEAKRSVGSHGRSRLAILRQKRDQVLVATVVGSLAVLAGVTAVVATILT